MRLLVGKLKNIKIYCIVIFIIIIIIIMLFNYLKILKVNKPFFNDFFLFYFCLIYFF
jgi:hypothetical protein